MASVLGLGGGYFHDASACLVVDGDVVSFVEEERFTRRKRNSGSRSCSRSAAYCLHNAGLSLKDVDEIAIGWNPSWPTYAGHTTDAELIRELLDPSFLGHVQPSQLTVVGHHEAHAASAFYCSGFASAAVVVADGAGDGASTSIYIADDHGLQLQRSYPFTQSLGWLYEAACNHAGVGRWAPGTLMGLAAYAEDRSPLPFVAVENGGYEIRVPGATTVDAASVEQAQVYGYLEDLMGNYSTAFEAAGVERHKLTMSYSPSRGAWSSGDFPPPAAVRLAADVQETIELCMIQVCEEAMELAQTDRLCIAGGVGLNCTSNGRILRSTAAADVFVQPASGDAGVAIGAALEVSRRYGDRPMRGQRLRSVALGPSFSSDAVRAAVERSGMPYEYFGSAAPRRVAQDLARGKIVGWFVGRAEGGPRALGQRSILADPSHTQARHQVNAEVKFREAWRPFAPSILAANMSRFAVEAENSSDFMIVAHEATEIARELIPAVVHVDGSLRPQRVDDDASPYGSLLESLDVDHGIGAVLNTSFNNDREPIVLTPDDAIRTFATSALDVLAIDGYRVHKLNHVR